ncbi:hypothetical protein ACFYT4_14935 [Streptomyces sp. NPDC004609]|uniref:hypothetical protein n=1 Tax=Streptomyces sp. NPDC004609 TaxID=3364704 RepID=UPI003696ECB1
MNQLDPPRAQFTPSGGTRPGRVRALFGALLFLDAVVTCFPPLYWAAGNGGSRAAALTYVIGGGAFVVLSILVMYAVDRAGTREPAGTEGVRP